MLTASHLKGNWGTLLLPIDKKEQIDFNALAEELDYLISAGLNGIYTNGSAGEFYNQRESEFDDIQLLLAEKCRSSGMKFQIGVSHSNPLNMLDRIKRTRSLKPDAFQIIFPDWIPLNDAEQILFMRKVADVAGDIPLVLYNPPHAKTVLRPEQLRQLHTAIPSLIGVKLASGDQNWFQEMIWSKGAFSVFVPGHRLASGFSTGIASGSYSNMACLSPRGSQAWWNLMQDDMESALETESRILRFFEECIIPFIHRGYSNPALDKLLAAAGGWSAAGTRLRWPYQWIAEEEVGQVGVRARYYLPEFFKTM